MAHWRRVCAVLSAPDVSINADRLVLNNYFLQNQVATVQQATRHAGNIVSLSLMWSRAWCLARTKITYNSERNYSAEIYRNIFDSWNLFFGISTNGGMCRFFGRFSAPPENLANSACGVAEFGGYKFLLEQTAQLRPMSAADLSKLARQKHIKYKCSHLYNSK